MAITRGQTARLASAKATASAAKATATKTTKNKGLQMPLSPPTHADYLRFKSHLKGWRPETKQEKEAAVAEYRRVYEQEATALKQRPHICANVAWDGPYTLRIMEGFDGRHSTWSFHKCTAACWDYDTALEKAEAIVAAAADAADVDVGRLRDTHGAAMPNWPWLKSGK